MKNIAILVGNSEYQNLSKLHLCREDISSMQNILNLSKKFEIHIFENYQSEQLKSELSKIIRELEKFKINELLFYYTGHGLFKERFYYLPINFTDKQFETTSLSNDELDNMLKSLDAEMVIKIIDACQSGQQYIKESDQASVKKSLTQHFFKKCHFFFSSMNNQSSMGDDKGSYFTNAIIESILAHKTDSIRYMDVQSYVADYFSSRSESQTPFFVNQSNATEIFLNELTSIQKEFENNNLMTNNGEDIVQEIENDKIDIVEKLKTLSKKYIVEDVAQKTIKCIFDENNINSMFNDDIKLIYDIKIEKHNDYDIGNINKLYNEIEKNKQHFFINLEYRQEAYTTTEWVPKSKKPRNAYEAMFGQSHVSRLSGNISLFAREEYEEKEVQKYRNIVNSICLADDILPIGIAISLNPKEDINNINRYLINIINFHNNLDIVFYSNIIEYYKNNWHDWKKINTEDWIKSKESFCDKDKILEKIQIIIKNYNQKIIDNIFNILKQEDLKIRE
ncbi:caspase family protein [Campylobacter lari]|nr:caspase family protein [Campylobacter lari]